MVCSELGWGMTVEGLLVLRWDLQRSSSREEASVAAMWAAMSISDLQGRGADEKGRGGEGRGKKGRGGEGRGAEWRRREERGRETRGGEGKREVESRGPCRVDDVGCKGATNATLRVWFTLLCHPGGRGRPSCSCGGPLHR